MGLKPRRGITYNRRLLGFDYVDFTRHALDRMKQRGITKDEVYRTVEKPDVTGLATAPNRVRVRRECTGTFDIDVVYELMTASVRIITTFKNERGAEKGKPPTILRQKSKQRKPQRRGRKK